MSSQIRTYGNKSVPKLLEKVNIIDIINDTNTGGTGVPLSAEQGKLLRQDINATAANLQQSLINILDNASVDYNTLGKLETQIKQSRTDTTAAISAEAARTDAAIASLSTASSADLVALTTTIQHNKASIETALADEVARAATAEKTLSKSITQEVADRQTALVNEAQARTNAIDAETARATAAEANLLTAIDTEATRAQAQETALQNNITLEESRALGAEAVLSTSIATERTQRIAADSQIDLRLASIESGLVAGLLWKASLPDLATLDALDEATLQPGWAYYVGDQKDVYVVVSGIEGDRVPAGWTTKSFLKFADFAEVTGMVTTERNRALVAEAQVAQDLTNETRRAQTAETQLDSKINNEIARAQAQESILQTNITTEATERTQAVTLEANRAIAEETRIEALVTAEVVNRDSAIAVETARAVSEEARIEALLNTENANRIADVDAEEARATAAEQAIAQNLANAVTNINTSITNEATTRADADAAMRARLNTLEGDATIAGSVANAVSVSKQEVYDYILRPKVEGRGSSLLVVGDTITVQNVIADGVNGIAFGEVVVYMGGYNTDAVMVEVASVAGSLITLSTSVAGEFDGKLCKVQYFYRAISNTGAGTGLSGEGLSGA